MLLQLIVGLALDMSGQVSWTKVIWIFPHESWENTRLKIEIVLVLAHLHFEVIWSKIPSLRFFFFFHVLLTLFKLSSESNICNVRPNQKEKKNAFLTKINSWSSWGPEITLVSWRYLRWLKTELHLRDCFREQFAACIHFRPSTLTIYHSVWLQCLSLIIKRLVSCL